MNGSDEERKKRTLGRWPAASVASSESSLWLAWNLAFPSRSACRSGNLLPKVLFDTAASK